MAWIEAHQSLADHPKVIMVSESLDICEAQVIGHLMFLWWWAVDRAPDGNLSEYGARIVERAARWQGAPGAFYDALLAARFVDDDGSIHDWYEYAGKWLDRRAANKHRAQMSRERARTLRARSAHVAVLPTQPTQPTEREREAAPSPEFSLPQRIGRLWEQTHGRIVMAHESGELRDMVSAHGEEAVAAAIVKSQGKYDPIAYARTVAANHNGDSRPASNGKAKPKDGRAPIAQNDPNADGVTVTSYTL